MPPRLVLKTRDTLDDNYQEPVSRKNKGPNKTSRRSRHSQPSKRRKAATPSSTSGSSDEFSEGEASAEPSDEDADSDDEDDLPDMQAPSHFYHLEFPAGTGPEFTIDLVGARAPSFPPMFANSARSVDEESVVDLDAVATARLDSDNDEEYEAVNDVPESEQGDLELLEERRLIDEFDDSDDEGLNILHWDGMSEIYGLVEEDEVVSPGSESARDIGERRVRFQVDHLGSKLSESPTFSRALLPSLMAPLDNVSVEEDDDDYDTDATEEYDQPTEQRSRPSQIDILEQDVKVLAAHVAAGPFKGPRWGVFVDAGDRPSGVLDPSGRKIVIANIRNLGTEFVRRSETGSSTVSSPSNSFVEPIDGLELVQSGTATPLAGADPLLAPAGFPQSLDSELLNHGTAMLNNLEREFPPINGTGLAMYGADDALNEDEYDLNDVINVGEASGDGVIAFQGDNDAAPQTPAATHQNMYMPSLNSSNITAWSRKNEPDFVLHTSRLNRIAEEFSSPLTRSSSRKRKNTSDSPYASRHYAGVTPVQRVSEAAYAPNNNQFAAATPFYPDSATPSIPDSDAPQKRQKLMKT